MSVLGDPLALDVAWRTRRWTRAVLEDIGVGFDSERYVLPVRDADGALVGTVRYLPPQLRGEQVKLTADKGSRRELFPAPESEAPDVVLVEGEATALTARSAGLAAIAVPGSGAWRPEWARRLAPLSPILIVPDCDDVGRGAARTWAAELHAAGAVVRILDIAPERSDGYDVGDLLAEASTPDELRRAGRLILARGADLRPFAPSNGRPPPSKRQLRSLSALQIRSERVHWLWALRVAFRGLTVVAGEKGLGKSIATNAWLTAQITRGMLDGELPGPSDVLIATAEDDWRSVVKPRLMAHGADLGRVFRIVVEDDVGEVLLTLPDDVGRLEAEIRRLRSEGHPVRLLVVDPIGAFLPETVDSHRDASVRRALAPLAALAERLDLAIIVVAHLTKEATARYIARVSGSAGLVNASRSVLIFARDPNDTEGEQGYDRLIVQVASNWSRYAPALAASIESRTVDTDDGEQAEVGYFEVKGESQLTVDDLQRDEDPNEIEEAIAERLATGAAASREVKRHVADELRCSQKTVERGAMRMRKRGELVREQGGFPRRTTWRLSDTQGVPTVPTDPVGTVGTPQVSEIRGVPDPSLEALAGWENGDTDALRHRDAMLGERWEDDE